MEKRVTEKLECAIMCHKVLVFGQLVNSAENIEMSSSEEKPHWNMFDGVETISTSPEVLMSEINSAITALEYTRATAFLQSRSASASKNINPNGKLTSQYDAQLADEAYKAGLASMAAGKLDEAVNSLNAALSKCPPDKTSAVAKLQSLISRTSQLLHKSSN